MKKKIVTFLWHIYYFQFISTCVSVFVGPFVSDGLFFGSMMMLILNAFAAFITEEEEGFKEVGRKYSLWFSAGIDIVKIRLR